MYYLAFYEDGKFSNYIGEGEEIKSRADLRLALLALQMKVVFPESAKIEGDCLSYDRYGTACAVKIVKID